MGHLCKHGVPFALASNSLRKNIDGKISHHDGIGFSSPSSNMSLKIIINNITLCIQLYDLYTVTHCIFILVPVTLWDSELITSCCVYYQSPQQKGIYEIKKSKQFMNFLWRITEHTCMVSLLLLSLIPTFSYQYMSVAERSFEYLIWSFRGHRLEIGY